MGLAVLTGGLAFVGTTRATELIQDGSFENTSPSSNPVVKVGGLPDPEVGQGWSTFSTYLYSTQYTLPGPVGSGVGYLRPYPSGTYGITQSSTESHQTVSLTAGTTLTPSKIDAGQGQYNMSAWFSSYLTQGDYSDLTLQFLGDADEPVSDPVALGGSDFIVNIPTGANSKYGNAKEWAQDVRTGTIPSGARKARVTIQSTSVGGAPDGYVDVVSLDVVDTALTIPALISAIPANNAVGVGPFVNITVTLQNRSTSVDPATIKLFLDEVSVTPSISPVVNNETVVSYSAGILPPLSAHTYQIIFGDNSSPSIKQTNSFSFKVVDFPTLPASAGTPLGSEDTSKPGFNVAVYQVEPVTPGEVTPVQVNLPGSIAFLESVLAGLVGPNIAELSGATETNRFAVPGVVNWINSSGVAANFPDDTGFPGIPGTFGTEDNFVEEISTYLRFPTAGFYQLGVNNEDAFRLTAGLQSVQTLRIVAPTNFVIPTVPIATNITQLQFGGALPATPIEGQIVYGTPSGIPDDACSLGGNPALAGKIVLLDRDTGGACNSADKAEQAQLAGAVAVLLITPGDAGFPFRIGDINPNVRIPVLVIAENYGGSVLKSLLLDGKTVDSIIQTDTQPRIAEWDGPKGFGAVDVIAGFAVPAAGVYPMRLLAGQETGNANLEWFSVKSDGTRVLINDPVDPQAIRAFRARTAVTPATFNPPTFADGKITLSWTGTGTLQEALSLDGDWSNSSNQSNPQTIPASDSMKVFRLIP
ncbi:MAG TPA: hypothetical protein DCE44_08360 [Verrucomicrobiales bacterium]|nr:hypothetical protein [Verrucomicrobiales bacterium]